MTDFHTLLKESIVDRGIDDPADRREVYAQARRAMIRKLWAREPPLSEDDIHTRIGAFDAAVNRIEAELLKQFNEEEEPEAEAEAVPEPQLDPEPELEAEADEDLEPEPVAENGHDHDPPSYLAEDDEALEEAAAYSARSRYRPMPPRTEAESVSHAGALTRYEGPPVYGDPVGYGPPYEDEVEQPPAYEDDGPYEEAAYVEDPAGPYREPRVYGYAPATKDERYGDPRPYEEEAYRGYDDPYAGVPYEEEDYADEPLPAPARPNRWADPGPAAAMRRHPLARLSGAGLSDRDKAWALGGAIGLLLVALVGLGVYLLLPARDEGVTIAISERRSVSDAATAARVAEQEMNVVQDFVLFDGRDPNVFQTSPDNPVRFSGGEQDGFVRVSSSAGSGGARALIGPGLASRLAGTRVRVTLDARSSNELGAATMRFAYQSGVALSHWQTASLGAEYDEVGLIWRVPTMQTSDTGHYLLIEPGIPGDGTGVDIRAIRIDVLAADST